VRRSLPRIKHKGGILVDVTLLKTEFFNDLSKHCKKLSDEAIHAFYRHFQHSTRSIQPFSKFIHDTCLVDLEELSDQELVTLHQHTKWVAPSYVLRKRYTTQIELATEAILLLLVQMQSHLALKEWMRRYEQKIEKAPDELLILFYKEGNLQARNILTRRHKSFIKNVIRQLRLQGRFFRGMDEDDVFQESMVGYLKAIKDYKIERKMKFTVFTRFVIIKYLDTIINQSKNTKNASLNDAYSFHAPIRSDAEMTFEESFESDHTTPDELAIKKDTLRGIWDILTELEKEVLVYYTEGYSYEEIGGFISKDKKAVDNTRQRIRTKAEKYEATYSD